MSNENEEYRGEYKPWTDLDQLVVDHLKITMPDTTNGDRILIWKMEMIKHDIEKDSKKMDRIVHSLEVLEKYIKASHEKIEGNLLSQYDIEKDSEKMDRIIQSLEGLEKSIKASHEKIDGNLLSQYAILTRNQSEFKEWISGYVWVFIWFTCGAYGLWHYFIR